MYYVRVITRSSGGSAKGTPRQALAYITDGHDARRDPNYSDAEIAYIARMGEGWKTDLEGGRVPLAGLGSLAGIADEEELASRFEGACQPWHDKRGTTGYKSFTFTLPKEVSLFAEGHREAVREAMIAAANAALAAGFPGKEVAAVGAMHTRNEAGEIHHHLHVLVGKFARDRATGRVFSLNSKAGGNTGSRLRDLKLGWKEAMDRELGARLGLRVEQSRPYARPALVLPGGEKVPALNRESRRLLDKHLCPVYEESGPDGRTVRRVLRLSDKMDGRIFEVASGKDGAGWSSAGFLEIAPDQRAYLGRYEKRVETLKKAGYLSAEGKVTPAFRLHMCARAGIDTPELQRIRIDLATAAARQSQSERKPVPVVGLWDAVHRYESIRRRVERLGISREDLRRIHEAAQRRRPTPEILRAVRKRTELMVLATRPRHTTLARTKTIGRAWVDLQRARARAAYLIALGLLKLQYTRHKRLAQSLKARARADLFHAKERRLAQVGRVLRPLFFITRALAPRRTRRLELAMARSAGLAASQAVVAQWKKKFVEGPREALGLQAERLQRPAQEAHLPEVRQAQERVASRDLDHDAKLLATGIAVLRKHRPALAAPLVPWAGNERALAARVVEVARGQVERLPKAEYESAIRAGRIGTLLEREQAARRTPYPAPMAVMADELHRTSARMRAFGLPDPFRRTTLEALPPRQVVAALTEIRRSGMLEEGTAWTLRGKTAHDLSQKLIPTLAAEVRRQRGLGE